MTVSRVILLLAAIVVYSRAAAQPSAVFIPRSEVPASGVPTKLIPIVNGRVAGLVNQDSIHYVLIVGPTGVYSLMEQYPLPQSLRTRKLTTLSRRDDGTWIIGAVGGVLSLLPGASEWRVDSISDGRERAFLGSASNGDSTLFIAHADSVLSREIIGGKPFTRVDRQFELWMHSRVGMRRVFSEPFSKNGLLSITPSFVVVNNGFYVPFRGRYRGCSSGLIWYDGNVVECRELPTHPTIQVKDASATIQTSDGNVVVVYEGGGIAGGALVPNAIAMYHTLSQTADVVDNSLDMNSVWGGTSDYERLIVGTDAGLYYGTAENLTLVDVNTWFVPNRSISNQVVSVMLSGEHLYVSTLSGVVVRSRPISSVNQKVDPVTNVVDFTCRRGESIKIAGGAWRLYDVKGGYSSVEHGIDHSTVLFNQVGVYFLTDSVNLVKVLVLP